MGIHLINPFLIYKDPEKYYYLGGMDASLFPMSGIWMYLYTRTITASDNKFKRKWLMHFLSLVIVNIAFIPYYTTSNEEKYQLIYEDAELNNLIFIGAITNALTFAVYVSASLFEIYQHKKRIRFEFSYVQNIDLKWLRNLIASLIMLGLLMVILLIFLFFRQIDIMHADSYFYILLVIFIFGVGYFGFKQGTIFQYKEIAVPSQKTISEKKTNTDELKVKELNDFMQNNKPYLDPALSLYSLASSLNWSKNELSAVLNQHLKTNFYEYVNYYRVEEVKRRLKKNNNRFTVLAIAYDCGFNSKASFNRIFKQETGFTPSDYMKQT